MTDANLPDDVARDLIDCHTHLNDYTRREPEPLGERVRELQRAVDDHGVDQALVLTSYRVGPHRPGIEQVLDAIAPDPRLRAVEGIRATGEHTTDAEALRDRLRAGRIVGIKLYPGYEPASPADRAFAPYVEAAADHDAPIMIHTGDLYERRGLLKHSHPLHVDELAAGHPDARIVICHLGNPWFHDTAEVLYKNDNVHADISGLVLEDFDAPMERYLAREVRELLTYAHEPDRILYGTDWPLVKMGPYERFLDDLDLDPDDLAAIRAGNARRLFGLPETAAVPRGIHEHAS